MKHLCHILTITFSLVYTDITAQEFEPAKEVGAELGFKAMQGKQGVSGNYSFFQSLSGAYFYDLRNGIRTGFTHYNEFEGTLKGYSLPIYYAFRTKSRQNNNEEIIVESFGDLLVGILTYLIPNRIEYNIGPSFGYFQEDPGSAVNNSYKLNNEYYLSADARLRLTFQIWRFNLGGNFGLSYIPSKNFYYVSSDPFANGNGTNWSFDVAAIFSFSFD